MPIPLSRPDLDALYAAARPTPRQAAARFLRSAGRAMGQQVVFIIVGGAAVLYRFLWLSLALLVVACAIVATVFWSNGAWLNAVSAAVFGVGCLGVMAGLRWVASACTMHGRDGL